MHSPENPPYPLLYLKYTHSLEFSIKENGIHSKLIVKHAHFTYLKPHSYNLCGKRIKENRFVDMHNCITLLYSRHDHNLVNQLYFNKTQKTNKTKDGHKSTALGSWPLCQPKRLHDFPLPEGTDLHRFFQSTVFNTFAMKSVPCLFWISLWITN